MKWKPSSLAALGLLAAAASAVAVLAVLASLPATVRLSRSARVAAPPATVAAALLDLRRWASWAPPGSGEARERRYGGPEAGAGATVYWSDERAAGRLTVVAAGADAVEAELETERPRRSSSDLAARLEPDGGGTRVTCELVTERGLAERALALLLRTDRALERDLDDGLARLAALAEAEERVERYRVERSARVEASPAAVQALVADLRRWQRWSPWEEREPAPRRSWGGPRAGAGASYYWTRAGVEGQARATILAAGAERLELELELPERAAASDVTLALAPEGAGTRVTWVMTGEIDPRVAPAADPARVIASEVERALAGLKRAVEAEPAVSSPRSL